MIEAAHRLFVCAHEPMHQGGGSSETVNGYLWDLRDALGDVDGTVDNIITCRHRGRRVATDRHLGLGARALVASTAVFGMGCARIV